MSLSNLYFRGCFEHPSQGQVDAIEDAGGIGEVVDRSCTREDLNTCGKSVQQIFDEYSIYSVQKGLYKTWGEIAFPWEISSLTPNLFFELTEDKWAISTYRQLNAYFTGDIVILIEDDGYSIGLYQANQDILSLPGPFDYSKWDKICNVKTTIPIGLPTIQELEERYKEYKLEYFFDEWDEIDSPWSQGSYEQSLSFCQSQGGTLADFEKCMKDSSSDKWKEARVRKEFFYRKGDTVLVYGECYDVVCVWTAIVDMPADEATYQEYSIFKPGPYWQKIYCVNLEGNKCLEYQRKKEPELGYDVVQIGSLGHYVEVPVPYKLKPKTKTLQEMSEIKSPPVTLTQEQIDSLNQPS